MIPHHVLLPSFTVSCFQTFVLLVCDCSALCSMPMPQKFWSISNGLPPVHLHQLSRASVPLQFPQFVAEIDVCMLLHCALILPPTMTTFNWPQSVYTGSHMQSILCVDSLHVSEEPCAWYYTCAKFPFTYDVIHQRETHPLYMGCEPISLILFTFTFERH